MYCFPLERFLVVSISAPQNSVRNSNKEFKFSSENSFLNAACCVESVLPPLDILRETQEIERELGRMKKSAGGNYSDRLIDIDILLYGDLILHTPELEIPHPLMTERRFVMDPLAEIASDVVHPVLGKRLGEL